MSKETNSEKREETYRDFEEAMRSREKIINRIIELSQAGKDTTKVHASLRPLREEIAKLRNRMRSYYRRDLEKAAPISDFTPKQWEKLKKESGGICSYCGGQSDDLTADHIIPLVLGGNHTLSNITPACNRCNGSKGCRTPEQAGMQILKKRY